MREFLRPRGPRNADEERAAGDGTAPAGPSRFPTAKTEDPQPQSAKEEAVDPREQLGAFGEHVASVLAAAEAAADKVRAEAEREATDKREEAARTAEELRVRASHEVQAQRAAAQRLVEEAEVTSSAIRADAERYADERRRAANAEAAKLVRDAERHAATIADTAAERHRILLADIAASESRLRDLAKSLRTVAASLDDVLGDDEPVTVTAAESAESLAESLQARVGDGVDE